MAIKFVIAGAAGRMGRRIIALASEDNRFQLVGALESSASELLGQDAGQLAGIAPNDIAVTDTPPAEFDVLIDFSTPTATHRWLDACRDGRRPIIIGTTGHDATAMEQIRQASATIPVLKAANMSVGVNVLLRLVRDLARVLDESYDVEITEAHHRFKADAPSGTALALRDAVVQGRTDAGRKTGEVVHGRQGQTGQRPSGEIGIHALRIGDTVGEHTVAFGCLGETIQLSHAAHSRDTFAAGALRAAAWITHRSPGMYDMHDVLFGECASSR